ncbi:uncharacterized protein METZ01_LOCUS453984, partial [marine metagenome]
EKRGKAGLIKGLWLEDRISHVVGHDDQEVGTVFRNKRKARQEAAGEKKGGSVGREA